MRRLLFALAIMAIISFNSCNIDDGVNFHFQPLQIVSASLPDSFTFNEVHDIEVTFLIPDNCTLFQGFNVDRTDTTTRQVAVIGAIMDKQDCINASQEVKRSFKFEVRYPDPYLFQFWTGMDADGNPQYIEIEVPVNESSINP